MIASIILLNTLLGSSYLDLAVASAIGEASLVAAQAGSIPPQLPIYWPKLSETKERLRRRRREEPKAVARNDVSTETSKGDPTPIDKPEINYSVPQRIPPIDGSMLVHEKSLVELQDEIFQNIGTIAHDVASEFSIHLGLRPHTLEAVLLHEEDAPSFPEVLESVL